MNEESNIPAEEQIAAHRACIDEIDQQLVSLLNKRAEHSMAIRALKPQVGAGLYDSKREVEIMGKVFAANQEANGPLYNDHVQDLYEALLRVMKEIPLS